MTYCLAIKVMEGLVFASDSRSNAGVDYVSIYSKMHSFGIPGERSLFLLTAGNLATTQAVVNLIHRDVDNPRAWGLFGLGQWVAHGFREDKEQVGRKTDA